MHHHATPQPIRKIACITGKPGRAAELRDALVALEAATRREPGCRRFAFYQALTSADDFLLLEEFTDQAALDAHMQLPHTRHFFARQLVEGVRASPLPAE